MVTIIEFEEIHSNDFRSLNLDWLTRYKLVESHDLMVLNDPVGTIINRGGCIYLAEVDGKIVGSASLIKEQEAGVYELAKMAVHPTHQGKGISKLLLASCINKAREWKAEKISLFSNHQLTTALKLYENAGFKHVPVEHSPFITADVKMELML